MVDNDGASSGYFNFFLVKMRATMLLYEKQLQQDQLPQLQLPIVLYLQYFLLRLYIYIFFDIS